MSWPVAIIVLAICFFGLIGIYLLMKDRETEKRSYRKEIEKEVDSTFCQKKLIDVDFPDVDEKGIKDIMKKMQEANVPFATIIMYLRGR